MGGNKGHDEDSVAGAVCLCSCITIIGAILCFIAASEYFELASTNQNYIGSATETTCMLISYESVLCAYDCADDDAGCVGYEFPYVAVSNDTCGDILLTLADGEAECGPENSTLRILGEIYECVIEDADDDCDDQQFLLGNLDNERDLHDENTSNAWEYIVGGIALCCCCPCIVACVAFLESKGVSLFD